MELEKLKNDLQTLSKRVEDLSIGEKFNEE